MGFQSRMAECGSNDSARCRIDTTNRHRTERFRTMRDELENASWTRLKGRARRIPRTRRVLMRETVSAAGWKFTVSGDAAAMGYCHCESCRQ